LVAAVSLPGITVRHGWHPSCGVAIGIATGAEVLTVIYEMVCCFV